MSGFLSAFRTHLERSLSERRMEKEQAHRVPEEARVAGGPRAVFFPRKIE